MNKYRKLSQHAKNKNKRNKINICIYIYIYIFGRPLEQGGRNQELSPNLISESTQDVARLEMNRELTPNAKHYINHLRAIHNIPLRYCRKTAPSPSIVTPSLIKLCRQNPSPNLDNG